jgi:hypothetical protein
VAGPWSGRVDRRQETIRDRRDSGQGVKERIVSCVVQVEGRVAQGRQKQVQHEEPLQGGEGGMRAKVVGRSGGIQEGGVVLRSITH